LYPAGSGCVGATNPPAVTETRLWIGPPPPPLSCRCRMLTSTALSIWFPQSVRTATQAVFR
ncbi:MAG: hypothetical protein LBB48_03060, partial [Treponema sp.]|nr:hypothetical protein [Treponema sp.]